MYNKNKLEYKYLILILLVILVIFLGLTAFTIKQDRKLSPLESVVKDSCLFIINVVSYPFNYVGDKISDFIDMTNLYEKYEQVKEENEKVDLLNAKIKELESELDSLNETLELNKSLSSYSYLNTTVINRNIGYWYNNITIDKGSNHGVDVGMAVINSKGLVGKVIKTTNLTSTVKLITSSEVDNKISVKIQLDDIDIYGLFIGYNQDEKAFIVEGIDEYIDIPVGSMVVTTGMGGIFPSGILLGYVKEVNSDNFDLSKVLVISSNVDFDDLKHLTILKGVK